MAKMTKIALSYTIQSGSSGASFDYDVRDVFYINSDNRFLHDGDRGLENLMRYLLDSSERGGGHGSGRCVYSNAMLEVFESREMVPPKKEPGAVFYLSHAKYDAVTMAQMVEIGAVDYGVDRLGLEELHERQNELRKSFNKFRGLHRRDTNSDKLRNEVRKRDRAAKSMIRLLESNKSAASIRESEAFKKVEARRDKAVARLKHLEEMRDRNRRMMKAYSEELKKVEAQAAAIARQEREREQEKSRRVKARVDDMRKRHALYRTGQRPTRPSDLNKTQAQIEAEVEKELQHEHRLKHDSEYAAEYHSEQQAIQQAEEISAIQRAQEFMRRRNGEGGNTPKN